MNRIHSVAAAFRELMQSWEQERNYLASSISALANGFEGGLKFDH
ncbi:MULTISPECIES: hypothetical protein [Pseudomonas]|jgi:hypothetical protein|nr:MULTISPECIES: hypothetical protein [Pseudomonas]